MGCKFGGYRDGDKILWQVIEIFLIGSSFLVILMLAVLAMAFHIKKWAQDTSKRNEERYDDLKKQLDEMQRIFKTEIMDVLKGVKGINEINDNK